MRKAVIPVTALVLLAALVAPVIQSQGLAGAVRKMRTDFIALRCLQDASAAATQPPLDRDLARRRLQRALELAPDEPTIAATAPGLFVAIGAYPAATNAMARAGAPDPLLWGEALLMLGHRREGLQVLLDHARRVQGEYQAHMRPDEDYAMELNNIGYTLANAGVALDEAKSLLEQATTILPLEPNCIDSLGWVYYRLGDFRKAAFYLERAVRLQPAPGAPELLYHLGAAYSRSGNPARARDALLSALALDPQNPEALHELQTLGWELPAPAIASGERSPTG